MKISLSPIVSDKKLALSLFKGDGDLITVNGEAFDFSPLPDGATLTADEIDSEYFVGNVERVNGDLQFTLLFPISENASRAACFPEPIVNPPEGTVDLPA